MTRSMRRAIFSAAAVCLGGGMPFTCRSFSPACRKPTPVRRARNEASRRASYNQVTEGAPAPEAEASRGGGPRGET